jgi:hypothetical protein
MSTKGVCEPAQVIAEVDPTLSKRESVYVEAYLRLEQGHRDFAELGEAEIQHAIVVMRAAGADLNEMLVDAVLPRGRRREDLSCRNF